MLLRCERLERPMSQMGQKRHFAYVRSWRILLKNSKTAPLEKSRQRKSFAILLRASHFRSSGKPSSRFRVGRRGPWRRQVRNASAAL
jgi:hypothetical protein